MRLFVVVVFSDAGGGVEADPAGSRGRLCALQEGPRALRGPASGVTVPAGLKDSHRPRGAAPLPGLML